MEHVTLTWINTLVLIACTAVLLRDVWGLGREARAQRTAIQGLLEANKELLRVLRDLRESKRLT